MYKLLIVDDNYVQIQSVLHFINWSEFDIDIVGSAQDGEEGLQIIEAKKPDIVITDVVMPVMDGIEMMNQALDVSPDTRFIFMSCHDSFEYLKNAIDNNAVSYILKPIDAQELRKSVEKLIHEFEDKKKYDALDKLIGESLDIFRENFLYRLLYSAHMDTHYLENTLHNLGFDKYRCFVVAKIEIISGNLSGNIYQLQDLAKKYHSLITGYAVIESDSCCVMTFMREDNGKIQFMSDVQAVLKEFKKGLLETYHTNINIGLSLVYHTLYDAKYMLSQASFSLENSLDFNDDGIYIYKNLQYAEIELDTIRLKESLAALLDGNNSIGVNEFLDKYYPRDVYFKKNYVKRLCVTTVTTLQLLLTERNMDFKDLFDHSAVIWDKLDQFDSIKDTRQWLFNILTAVLEYINSNEKSKYMKIVQNIMQYIDKNYDTISSVEDITENMYISVSYAKRIFKKYTGKTIFDYLFTKRMEAAKKLLSDPYAKVYEVAEMVGYKSKAYFTEAFRKYTGMTPKDFQQNRSEKE